ncbi:hypothetical protein Ancab_038364 [Ancistrocladus abbreviatus]
MSELRRYSVCSLVVRFQLSLQFGHTDNWRSAKAEPVEEAFDWRHQLQPGSREQIVNKIGTLLVTASIQGHNINVFRIMPGHQGSSSASNVGNSYVHLYRLQCGLTNAVIQDISFSDDSHWIMISSSRGTNHLFAIYPLGGPVNLQFADPSFKNSGLRDYSSPALQ